MICNLGDPMSLRHPVLQVFKCCLDVHCKLQVLKVTVRILPISFVLTYTVFECCLDVHLKLQVFKCVQVRSVQLFKCVQFTCVHFQREGETETEFQRESQRERRDRQKHCNTPHSEHTWSEREQRYSERHTLQHALQHTAQRTHLKCTWWSFFLYSLK